jgi:excinuclease UvrABC nuclease subunit
MNIHEEVMYVDKPVEKEWHTAVYRCYDSQRKLLYVGMSMNPEFRFTYRRRQAAWWRMVDHFRTHVTWYRSRYEAQKAERAAIVAENPEWNIRYW